MQDSRTFRSVLILAIAGIVTVAVDAPRAQAPDEKPPTFEVASVKPNKLNGGPQNFQCCAGGRVTITGLPLRQLISIAYGSDAIQTPGQIVGGPGWLSDRFDIVAKAEGDLVPDAQGRPTRLVAMLRALLEDRFQVKVHNEMRETQTYALVLANKDGKLGPRLKPSDCHGPDTAPPPDPTGQAHPCGRFWGNLTGNQNARGIEMVQLARSLAGYWVISRPVFDRTGLTGLFDFQVEFTPAFLLAPNPDAPPIANPSADSGPNIFTALQEQLGLKLQGEKAQVEYLVIDRAEQPTPDWLHGRRIPDRTTLAISSV
jgi:uncharacterized protein (TIGR03435 family)